jgi:hypothetical protein
MSCEKFNAWLQESLDGPSAAMPAEVQDHAAECTGCRGLKEAAAKFEAGLRLLTSAVPGPGLSSRIVAAVLQENMARRRRRQRMWAMAVLAASLLLAVGTLVVIRGSILGQRRESVAGVPSSSKVPGSRTDQTPGSKPSKLPQLFGDLVAFGFRPGAAKKDDGNRVAYAIDAGLQQIGSQPDNAAPETVAEGIEGMGSLVSLRLRRTADQGKTLLDIVTPMTPASTGPLQPGASSPPLTDASDSVQAGLKPVTGSARRAVDLFMREVPGMGSDK